MEAGLVRRLMAGDGDGRAVGVPRHGHLAAGGEGRQLRPAIARVRPRLPEGGDRGDEEARVAPVQRLDAEAEAGEVARRKDFGRAQAKALDYGVGVLDQGEGQATAGGRGEIERDALL